MSKTFELARDAWGAYFDTVSRGLAGKQVDIEIAALSLGSQVAAAWLPVFGVTYDPKNDLLAVMADGLDHMIRHPRQIFVDSDGAELHSIHAIDGDGNSQIIRFRSPLSLPGAAPA
ncbi:hypothetical protein GTP56_18510 [Duganella sp. FT134W]|uniref:Uncharacterized protein n=1 Tax=Duganella margarita TaxID=2692170 RepID=A0A7X4H3Z4_9BURK|nr:DUF5335 domain-containing protein [Duganella margarita]MYM74179.1 hypothetical protein [Duganella margarita]